MPPKEVNRFSPPPQVHEAPAPYAIEDDDKDIGANGICSFFGFVSLLLHSVVGTGGPGV
jgi:hypothetical protein